MYSIDSAQVKFGKYEKGGSSSFHEGIQKGGLNKENAWKILNQSELAGQVNVEPLHQIPRKLS